MSGRQWSQLFALLLVAALGIFFTLRNEQTRERLVKVERVEDPCVLSIRGNTCQDRTCVRLRDVGYELSGECKARLAREEVAPSGGNNPSGQPGPQRRPAPEPQQPASPTPTTPTAPAPTPSPGNSLICTPGTLPVLPAVCL